MVALQFRTPEYLQLFRDIASLKLSEDELRSLVSAARASAGGKAKAAKRTVTLEFAEWLSQNDLRLFAEVGGDLTDWIQITPGPGSFAHPKYGMVDITPQQLSDFVSNFHAKVYQEHIPVDAEHKTKQSGAMAYYREMKVGHDGKPGVFAKMEITPRGKKVLGEGGFKYFSPEFYDEWEDNASGKVFKNVITGGAFTTRPFFKDKALAPIGFSEFSEDEDDDEEDDGEAGKYSDPFNLINLLGELAYSGFSDDDLNQLTGHALAFIHALESPASALMKVEPEMAGEAKTAADAAALKKASDDEAAKLAEAEAKKAAEDAAAEELKKASAKESGDGGEKTFTERQFNEAMALRDKQFAEVQAQLAASHDREETRQFTEMVTGKGGANDGLQWFGEPEAHVNMLKSIKKAFGEDSDAFKSYVDQQNKVALALKESRAFSEIGSTSGVSDPVRKVEAEIKKFGEENKLDTAEAMSEYFRRNPRAYAEYNSQTVRALRQNQHP